jgi:hypothetical protein
MIPKTLRGQVSVCWGNTSLIGEDKIGTNVPDSVSARLMM